jgi:pimeloyl-ACP methyl ester carboxylesterase/class 3 adenylate cyclase
MEPRIQYATTSDGVSIAYYVLGDGPPLLWVSGLWGSHLSRLWTVAHNRRAVESLAEHFTVIRYDGRGSGMSDRDPSDYSLEGRLRDIEAVVTRVGVGKLNILGLGHGALAAVAFAARFPRHVARLVLSNPYARGDDLYKESPRMRFVAALEAVTVEDQWEFTSQAIVSRSAPRDHQHLVQEVARVCRDSMGPLELLAFRDANRQIDVTDLLSQIEAPTLIIYTEVDFTPMTYSRTFASTIPNAELVVFSGSSVGFALAPSPEMLSAIKAFLGVGQQNILANGEHVAPPGTAIRSQASVPSGTAVILFADIAESTALTEHLGDTAFRTKARDLDDALRAVIREHAGTAIEGKLLGDGVLAVFTSARQAIEAALACGRAGGDAGLPLHLGLHAGDVIREDNNVYGGAVNIASRISGLSAPGEVLVSDVVRTLARTSAGVRFEDRGEQSLKGVGEKLRVWAVISREAP